jgi:hypothetical protein
VNSDKPQSITVGEDVNFHALEDVLLNNFPYVEIETAHLIAPGLYARTIKIPAGTVLTGYKHKTANISIVSKGLINIFNTIGQKVNTFKAGDIFVSQPDAQRAGFALEDTVWTDIHATNETDLDKIAEDLVFEYKGQLKPQSLKEGNEKWLGQQ